ncbi:MAG TPA: Holliday junction branch migration protein RuvA [Candidatus Cloacimonetes bacterium]|nr:Holliday junction branch migration protein RuvA [Candidatus Cloacimonadota bacterium]
MIFYLKGILAHKSPIMAVIDTGGVGWEILIPVSTFEVLPNVGSECSLYAHLNITQDDMRVFGFASYAEKELFVLLNKVSGIGPKIAISVLSTLSVSAFIRSVRSAEEALLTRVPGIGKKTAQRIIIELKDKVHHLMEHLDASDLPMTDGAMQETEDALLALGFNLQAIQKELKLLKEEELAMPAEQLIKELIKRLYQRAK